MPMSFQFSFLGKEHNYVASVTRVGKAGVPVDSVSDPANTVFYGMPETFCSFYESLGKFSYIYNVRGHDFLSHMGHWRSQTGSGTLTSSRKIYGEMDELRKFADLDQKAHGGDPNLITSFGPAAGSFFAEGWRPRLKRYAWENLPPDLNRKLQELKYGGIWDVALNASNGWVLQLDEGRQWIYGGSLHPELVRALSEVRDKNVVSRKWNRVSITRLFLNHQHHSEFVLLFSDGRVYARLHQNFQEKLEYLLQIWAIDRKKHLDLDFKSSCNCPEASQRKADASYYNLRGLFHMKRGDPELAYGYLREARIQNPKDDGIRNRYMKALNEFRTFLKDPVLEQYLEQNSHMAGLQMPFPETDSSTVVGRFRQDYVWMMTNQGSIEGGLNSVIGTSCEGEQQEEWSCNSYGTAADTDLCEVASTPSDPSHRLSELDGSLTELARHFTV